MLPLQSSSSSLCGDGGARRSRSKECTSHFSKARITALGILLHVVFLACYSEIPNATIIELQFNTTWSLVRYLNCTSMFSDLEISGRQRLCYRYIWKHSRGHDESVQVYMTLSIILNMYKSFSSCPNFDA